MLRAFSFEEDPMTVSESTTRLPLCHVWEDLVNDFLEMACFLKDSERTELMDALRQAHMSSETIHVHPSFSIDGRLVVILEEQPVKECWIYNVKENRIQKMTL